MDNALLVGNVVLDDVTFVHEGWWHPNAKSGKVHDHPERPNGNWSTASHRLCEPVYTKRPNPEP